MSGMGGLQRVGLGRMMGGSGSHSKLLFWFFFLVENVSR